MTELHDALRNLDRPTAPTVQFAARLEAQWMTALESEAPAPPRPATVVSDEPANVVVLPVHASRRHRPRFYTRTVLVAAAAVIVLIAVGVVFVRRDPDPVETPPPPTTAPTLAPTTTVLSTGGTVTASHPFIGADAAFGDAPKRITNGRTGIWVPLGQSGRAELLDRGTLETLQTVETGLTTVTEVVDAGGAVWFAGEGGVATLADGAEAPTLRPTLMTEFEWTISAAGQWLWAAQFGDVTVHRIDLATGDETTFIAPAPVSLLTAGPSLVWILSEPQGATPTRMTGFDAATTAVAVTADVSLPAGAQVGNLQATDDDVWLAGGGAGAFVRQIHNDGIAGIEVALPGDYADGMAIDDDGIWIAVRFGTSAYRFAMATGAITSQVTVPERTADVALDSGALFVASYDATAVQRISPPS